MGGSPSVARYGFGVACLLLVAFALGLAARELRHRVAPELTGAASRLAEIVIGLGLLIGELELLGAVGLFRLGPIVLASVVIGAAARRSGRRRGNTGHDAGDHPPVYLLAVAVLAAAAVLAEWAGPTLQSYDVGIRSFDSLWYHLPWAASFAQTGSVVSLRFTDVEYLTPFYPASAELFHALGIVLLGRDTLSPALNLGWLGLALTAGYCIGRPRGVGPLTLLGVALACATPMMWGSQAGTAANDIAGVVFLLAAVALLGEEQVPLAALAAGLALSTKLTLLAPVLALTLVVPRERLRSWIGVVTAAGSFWYLRNLIAVGNPLPWVGIPGLATPAPALQQHTAFSIAHYLTGAHAPGKLFSAGLASGFGGWWIGVIAAAVAGPVLCLVRGDRRVRALGLVALIAALAYLITPESAAGPAGHPLGFAFNLRYAAPALALSLAILPLAAGRRLTLAVLFTLLVLTMIKARLWPDRHLAGALGFAAAALVAAAAAPWPRMRRAVALVALVVVVVGGYPWQRHYLRGRYALTHGGTHLSRVWAFFRGVHDARVGIVGTYGGFFAYPLSGLDDSNPIQYVGLHGRHGSFTPIGTCTAWRRAVNAGGYRYLVSTPARDPWHPRRLSFSPEGAWTAGAQVVLRYRAAGQPITVFELHGPLDPAGCPTA